jgi:[acyl-carrier-protein] S-malonyltransferase
LCEATGCEVCNINAPGQIVIGGSTSAIAEASARAAELGIKRVMSLKVGGAFHTSLMTPAADGLAQYLQSLPMAEPTVPLVGNGRPDALSTAEAVREELTFQLNHPVLWEEAVRKMVAGGARRFIEFGPGTVLTGMVKRIAPDVETLNVSSLASLGRAVAS